MSSSLAVPPVALGAQEPRVCWVPPSVSSAGQEAVELAALAGLHLDAWEVLVLVGGLGERADGKWAAFEVGIDAPRQNGKGSILETRELAGLFLFGEQLIIHSAHEQATSSEHFRRLLNLIEGVPEFDRRVMKAPRGKGAEAIELRGGQRIFFKTRTGGGGRGLTGDLVVLDEAMILPEATTAALVPTMAARSMHGNPQLWYAGSAVDQQKHEHGVVFTRVRERGIAHADRVAWFEWSAEGANPDQVPDEVRCDPEVWAQANPGMGIRISQEHIANECGGALGPREFAVERLGVGDWPQLDGTGGGLDFEAWIGLTDPDSAPVDPVCFAFDVTPERSAAAIGVAGFRADRLSHVEIVDHRPGTGWLEARLLELVGKHAAVGVKCDARGPAASLITELQQAGVPVETVNASEHAQGCGLIFDAVEQRTLRHLGSAELAAAVRGAKKRALGDAWAWSRKSSSVDISPLVACTLALWGSVKAGQGGGGFEW
jgi:hypothetical protein